MVSNEALARAWDEGAKFVYTGLVRLELGAAALKPEDNPYREAKPPILCGVCHEPATRLSSFGEDYWKHADGTVHEVYFAEPTA